MKKSCSVNRCDGSVIAKGFCSKHYIKFRKYGSPTAGYEEKSKKGEGSKIEGRYHRRIVNGKEKLEHVLIAEKALGRSLPKGSHVHHIDGDRLNNSNSNLVICPNSAYHMILHRRQSAYDATGHADWRICGRCHQYDSPQNLYISSKFTTVFHRSCEAEYKRSRRNNFLINKKERTCPQMI